MSSTDRRLERMLEPVQDGLVRMREILLAQIVESSSAVSDMTGHAQRFRGKQLRGALVLLSGDATGNSTDEHPSVAAIVEMIHLATLVHDDVLDGARTRRRVASVNVRWDNQIAVLLGDFLYSRAFSLSTDLSSRLASRVLSETTRRLCVGEIEQSTKRFDFELKEATYEAIASAKTATLYSAACELGARYPGGREDVGREMAQFGAEIGLAFQIVDDCLDVVGDAEVVGKPVGNDVEDGKITLPVLWTYARATEATRAAMRDIYTTPGLEGRRLAGLKAACDLSAGVEYSMARATRLVDSARARLAILGESGARSSLEELGSFVLERRW
ncbi:MAG: polyprenyl synthetase family protein [Planctomycetota bacterium]|nr:polyprenyl synthetase family protein [Planctomycetota bacterium]